jgi:hypothetical protein
MLRPAATEHVVGAVTSTPVQLPNSPTSNWTHLPAVVGEHFLSYWHACMQSELVHPGVQTPLGSSPLLPMPLGTFEFSSDGPGDASSVIVVPSARTAASGMSVKTWQYGLQGLLVQVVALPPTASS